MSGVPGAMLSPPLALAGLCWDENSSFLRGAAGAPPLIRAALASESANRWSENGFEIHPDVLFDAGDLRPSPGDDMVARIEGAVSDLLARGLRPICLGGDHAVTFPVLRALARQYPHLAILHFDAHPDLYDEFGGNRLSHASPFARIMEERLAGRLVQVGIRTINAHQKRQIARFGVEVVEMRGFREGLDFAFETPVYVSFDLDGLDPAFAPGVVHREPGGLSTRQALDVIHGIRAPIVGADIVEFHPAMDATGVTATVCAKLVKEIAGQMLETGPARA
jgi:arginase